MQQYKTKMSICWKQIYICICTIKCKLKETHSCHRHACRSTQDCDIYYEHERIIASRKTYLIARICKQHISLYSINLKAPNHRPHMTTHPSTYKNLKTMRYSMPSPPCKCLRPWFLNHTICNTNRMIRFDSHTKWYELVYRITNGIESWSESQNRSLNPNPVHLNFNLSHLKPCLPFQRRVPDIPIKPQPE